MATVQLERQPFPDLTNLEVVEAYAIGSAAKQLLGYGVMEQTIAGTGPLYAALKKLDIEPLRASTVEAYKTAMRREKMAELNNSGVLGHTVYWNSQLLSEYHSPVPEFVLQKALAIKRELPKVNFTVESLMVEQIPADPFLLAYLNAERYHIEVWDEPKFESELYG